LAAILAFDDNWTHSFGPSGIRHDIGINRGFSVSYLADSTKTQQDQSRDKKISETHCFAVY
jgi:hypothetical protein